MRPVRLRFTAEARDHIAAIYSYITETVDPDEVLILGVFHAAQDRERE